MVRLEGTLSGGKKWAEGTVGSVSTSSSPFQYVSSSTSASFRYIDITLDFKPSIIVVTGGNASSYTGASFRTYMLVYAPNEPIYEDSNLIKTVKVGAFDHDSYSNTSYNFRGDGSYIEIGNGVYRMPAPYTPMYNIRWIAYE